MSIWLVRKFYDKNDNPYYEAHPHSFWGHIKCCVKWYGWKGLKRCYLSEKKATKVAEKLSRSIRG